MTATSLPIQDLQWRACSVAPMELGEGPRLLPDGRVVAVDILRGQLWQVDLASAERTVLLKEIAVPLGAVAPISGNDRALLAAAADGIAILDDADRLTWLSAPSDKAPVPTAARETPAVRMNDAVCDPSGRFWAGTMALDATPGAGSLHRLDEEGSLTTVLTGLTIPNGPAFNGSGTLMYLADSAKGTITRYTVDPHGGTLSRAEEFVTIANGSPDGMITDVEDHLWVAIWGAGQVHRYRPNGSLERILPVPARQPTSVCFAGEDRTTLVVTTASIGLDSPGTYDGLVLAADVGIAGRTTPAARIVKASTGGFGINVPG
ncbi:SMP-30/gluconolactonase/LRE family protein [Arthrobacter sp. ISL-72]|uniref:SMP-30/gluconolactonase/LRE family protein n=1 Tax=Arthrobacter sp. ISL-72 TaxID=2819114 RepID=UPI001BEC2303|nr:SMP-30/gluconolactonase/LRE family protein [Arthrobacter sp. ISL-72]MBT2594042.1 SMP-30/gluconolactonase/LRE family protein [Arthrobacter sp. ISL-72]